MRQLSLKFGLLEVVAGLRLSVRDATVFTWCMMHFARRIMDDKKYVDVS